MEGKKRIEWVDVVKGLLILTVILGHSIQEILKVRGTNFEDNIWRNIIYSFHMPAFMAMSGYLVYRVNDAKVGNLNWLSLICKRIKQLIIPFTIWSIPLFFINHNVDHIWDYVLYPNKGYWFLWALFFIIVIHTATEWVCKKTQLQHEIAIGIVSLGLILIQMTMPNSKILGYEYIAFYFIFYMMGYYANKYKGLLPQNKIVILILFIIWAIMACFWTPKTIPFFLKGIPYIPSKVLQMCYRMLTPIIFIIWMYSTAPKAKIGKNRIWGKLIELGQMSLGIYVVHMVVKKLFAHVLFDIVPVLPIWSHVVIEFAALTIFSFFVIRLILKKKTLSIWLLGK